VLTSSTGKRFGLTICAMARLFPASNRKDGQSWRFSNFELVPDRRPVSRSGEQGPFTTRHLRTDDRKERAGEAVPGEQTGPISRPLSRRRKSQNWLHESIRIDEYIRVIQ